MRELNDFDRKTLNFVVAIQDLYKDVEDREAECIKMELAEETLTEDFTAMIYAIHILYNRITGEESDILDFVCVINRLIIQKILLDKGIDLN